MMTMKSTMNYEKWEIILVPFPFTDLSTTKKRPALIISPNDSDGRSDAVIALITSKSDLDHRIGDCKIQD